VALEAERAYQAVQDRLTGDATLAGMAVGGFHRDLARPDTARPHVVIGSPVATDAQLFNAQRHWQDCLILVKACGTAGQRGTLLQMADRIDFLLQEHTATVDGVYVVRFRRESAPPIEPELAPGGVVYDQRAQVYRTEAAPVPA
jgi:hypothetical protein